MSRSRTVPLPRWQQLLLALFAALLGCVLLITGSRLLVSGIAGYQVQAFIENWRQRNSEPNPIAWQVAADAADRAVRWHPGTSGYHLEQRGHLYQWQHYQHGYGDPAVADAREQSVVSLRQAIAARPSWPDNYLGLAHGKMQLWQLDSEFLQALDKAHYYGPWRPHIQAGLARISLQIWPQLPPSQQQQALETVQRSLRLNGRRHARQLLSLPLHTMTLSDVCARLSPDTPARDELCPAQASDQ
ncbi:hypothetical protein [Halopseudomonas salegens]|uniref:Uncharacterized protein n=1 Tax=Halopseudomonas salegens TaxID=1434072 RepID=A0A1H2FL34_9GAMM|nr:hypothetical protein [Halopseudomonas salegens]SDU08077.1 hypothetical protein SAMN05216210_1641 [Halopseudomonas salegens]